MSVVTPSATAMQYLASMSIGQQRYDLTEQSDSSGHTATRLMAPPRWRLSMSTLDAMEPAVSALWKVIAVQLRGRVNHLAVWDVTLPAPRGTARGALLTSGTTASGAASVSISGCLNRNLLTGGSFEIDSNADGLADGWTRYSQGAFGALSAARSGGVAVHGAFSQSLAASTLGSGSGDRQGITRTGVNISALAGAAAVASCTVLGTLNSSLEFQVAWFDGGGSLIAAAATTIALNTGYQSVEVSWACPANAVTCALYIYQHSNTGASPSFYVDAVQIEAGAVATPYAGGPTLSAGDWLQVGSGVGTSHLCMVTADAVANDAGVITVAIEPPTRQAFTAGTAVAWDKPVGYYRQTPDALSWSGAAGSADVGGFSFDLLESWR